MAVDSDWYVELQPDGGRAKVCRSSEENGFSIRIKQQKDGKSYESAVIEGVSMDDGTLRLTLKTPEMPVDLAQVIAETRR